MPDAELLPKYFSRHGYWSAGSGKILHYFIDAQSWDEYYPPNGWRCRCLTKQSAGPELKREVVASDEQVPPAFRHNAGKDRQLYTREHPYYQNVPQKQADNLLRGLNRHRYQRYGKDWDKITQDIKSAGYVVRKKGQTAGRATVKAANSLAKLGHAVELYGGKKAVVDGKTLEIG